MDSQNNNINKFELVLLAVQYIKDLKLSVKNATGKCDVNYATAISDILNSKVDVQKIRAKITRTLTGDNIYGYYDGNDDDFVNNSNTYEEVSVE